MKNILKILTLIFLLTSNTYAFNTRISSAHAIGIFDKNGNGENIQHLRSTKNDYNGLCYSKVIIIGKLNNIIPTVNIGLSIGHYQKSKSIYRNKIKIGEELTFKHQNITKGYFEVRVLGKLYDTKVFVK